MFLRDLLDQAAPNLTRLADWICWDKGTVSRYLSGDRIPPWDFIKALLDQADRYQKRRIDLQQRDHARELYRKALQASNNHAWEVEQLRLTLSRVEEELQASLQRIASLNAEIKTRQHQLESTEDQLHRISDPVLALGSPQAPLAVEAERRSLEIRKENVEHDLVKLRNELAAERDKRLEAEQERDRLRLELRQAVQHRVPAEASPQGNDLTTIGIPPLRWGRVLDALLVPAASFLGPIYLGWTYHYLRSAPAALRWATVLAVALPIWLVCTNSGMQQPGISRGQRLLIGILIGSALFALGVQMHR
ncbi:hypothetical protein ACSNOI_35495 [Actinomadura kijaniata]|uniref:hypothetical protein n=1 Tax=Actinomadura kijaniata TaxID=46161 RepID=UPI003F1CFF59